jgi:hypothetical protein
VLQATRDLLAHQLEIPTIENKAPMVAQLRAVLAEIAELAPPERKGTPLDQLAERRRARGAETKGAPSAEGSA